MTTIQVNGEARDCEELLTIAQLLNELGVPVDTVLVERNRQVVARTEFDKQRIEEGDVFELVRFVGGG
ncbi:MAG: sulfur carrier protein ThiS [Planctomycetes bacterium]|nr:sulfur carrier protein ThiS [Planctomycetota bacterium]